MLFLVEEKMPILEEIVNDTEEEMEQESGESDLSDDESESSSDSDEDESGIFSFEKQVHYDC